MFPRSSSYPALGERKKKTNNENNKKKTNKFSEADSVAIASS